MPGWANVPVVEHLSQSTELAAVIERGDGWQAAGEVAYGAGRGSQHVLFVTLLEGIGGGIVEGAIYSPDAMAPPAKSVIRASQWTARCAVAEDAVASKPTWLHHA